MSEYDQALKRPANYGFLTEREQWEIDKQLGILDWDGSCPHHLNEGRMCIECHMKYMKRVGEK